MEKNYNQEPKHLVEHDIRRMKLREYSDHFVSQTYTRISTLLVNVSFRIDLHMLQLLPTFYERFNEEPNEFFLRNLSIYV